MKLPESLPKGALGATFALIGALLLLLAAMAVKGWLIEPPAVYDPDPSQIAAPVRIDVNQAASRLARILGDERPHPVDSDAGDAVRERLITELRALGLEPRVTDDFACNAFARSRTVACARVRNVIATIAPSVARYRERPHLLISAHYDSTFAGPGAGDAGVGIASMTEIARTLRQVRNLNRPVTFLFNEGEEMGLLGARAFLARSPVAARVDTLINLEARGVEGPAIMFETSKPNAAAIAAYSQAVDRPIANSLTTDLYGLIPNSTDVAVFAGRNWTILNFAIIGNETRYHSAGDNLAALDRRSLQHMGDQALALSFALAVGETLTPEEGERLYADMLGDLIVVPMTPGLILLGLLTLGSAILAWRRRALGRPLLAMFVATASAAALAWLGQFLLGLLRDGDYWRGHPLVTTTAVYATTLAACLIVLLLLAAHADRTRLRAAYWLYFLLTGAALAFIAPGGAIFFLFPPLVAGAGLIASRWHPLAERIGAIAAALLVFLSLGPALALFEELMNSGPHWMFAPLGALILLPALIELMPLARRAPPVLAYATAADLFLLGWIAVALTPAYSEDRKQLFGIDYVWDEGGRIGRWAVNNDGATVPLPGRWERGELPWSIRQRWLSPAPAIATPAPRVVLVDQRAEGEGRRLTVRLEANGAQSLTLIAEPDVGLIGAGSGDFAGRFAEDGGVDPRYFLRCIGRSCDGATFEILVDNITPFELLVVGSRPGLPAAAEPLVRARPALAQPQYAPDSSITIARFAFDRRLTPDRSRRNLLRRGLSGVG